MRKLEGFLGKRRKRENPNMRRGMTGGPKYVLFILSDGSPVFASLDDDGTNPNPSNRKIHWQSGLYEDQWRKLKVVERFITNTGRTILGHIIYDNEDLLEVNEEEQEEKPEPEVVVDRKNKGVVLSHPLKPTDFEINEFIHHSPNYEKGESSTSRITRCVICSEEKDHHELVRNSCGHCYCRTCVTDYLPEKIQEDIHRVKCPEKECKQVVRLDVCLQMVPEEVEERWMRALDESQALALSREIECPFEDCSGSFFDDTRGSLIRACPHCWKVFCMRCRVQWHLGMSCRNYQLFHRISRIPWFRGLEVNRSPMARLHESTQSVSRGEKADHNPPKIKEHSD